MKKTLIALVTVIFHGANGRQEFAPGTPIESGVLPEIDEAALLKSGSIADPEKDEAALRWLAIADQRGALEFQAAREEVKAENASLVLGGASSDVVLPLLGSTAGTGTGLALTAIGGESSSELPASTGLSDGGKADGEAVTNVDTSTGVASSAPTPPTAPAPTAAADLPADATAATAAAAAPAEKPVPAAKGARR